VLTQWAGSCWYYLRYIDPRNAGALVDEEAERYWMPVDLYVGGAEHAVLHLLYARFWHKVRGKNRIRCRGLTLPLFNSHDHVGWFRDSVHPGQAAACRIYLLLHTMCANSRRAQQRSPEGSAMPVSPQILVCMVHLARQGRPGSRRPVETLQGAAFDSSKA